MNMKPRVVQNVSFSPAAGKVDFTSSVLSSATDMD